MRDAGVQTSREREDGNMWGGQAGLLAVESLPTATQSTCPCTYTRLSLSMYVCIQMPKYVVR